MLLLLRRSVLHDAARGAHPHVQMATVSNPAVPVKLQRVPKRGVPSLDEDLLDVMRCCLKKDPVERITTEVSTRPGSADWLAYALILLHDFTMEAAITWSEARKASYVRHAVREYTIHKALHHRNIVSLTDQPHSVHSAHLIC